MEISCKVPVKVNPLSHSHTSACKVRREIAEPQPNTLEYGVTLAIVVIFPVILIISIKVVAGMVQWRLPVWSSGQSSWLHNGDVLCFL
jgi:hypothetical protein